MHYYHRGMRCLALSLALMIASTAGSAFAQAPAPQPPAAPSTQSFGPGRYELKLDNVRDGVLYVPAGYKSDKPTPLLIWLHGAGGSGNVSENMTTLSDEFGFMVLAPDSREWTWDAILGQYGPDVDFLQRALRQTLSRYNVDKNRLWLGGFSDGASYSLSLGISYGDVFKQQPQTAKLLQTLMQARGLSTDGQAADGTECLDCIQTHQDQAQAALERDRRMEAEFAKSEAERLKK